jgi:4-hydroxybenzoate polyprenyl transferase
MRLDKPTGFLLLVYPSYWGMTIACPPGNMPSLSYFAAFGLGAIAMRGAGCTINDLMDKKYDAQVERTKDRPIASGAISTKAAIAFLAAESAVAASILFQFDIQSIFWGLSSLWLVACYPLAKRYTQWPQLVLGMSFNWGLLLGYSVMTGGAMDYRVVAPLYVSAMAWTVIYDTIYAHQDRQDDIAIGLKSTAIAFGMETKYWLTGFSAIMMAGLFKAGINSQQLWPYYAAVALTGAHLAHQIVSLDINNKENCWKLFKRNSQIGLLLFIGILMSKVIMDEKTDDEESNNTNDKKK